LSGEGAVGKSILSLHLAVATVLARDWAGTMPEPGAAMVISCEDDGQELHHRLHQISTHFGASLSDLAALLVTSLAGQDAMMATPRRDGLLQTTKLFGRVFEAACDIKPKLIVLDNSADIFGGGENDRAQVRQFIGILRGLAMAANAGVLLTSHPSLTGISSGTGLSGSTAWNASVRSRMYFKRAITAKDEEPDPDLRILEVMKANYGPVGETVTLRWKDGLFLPVAGMSSLERMAREQRVADLFLTLLDRSIDQGRVVSDKKTANTFAPNWFATEPEAKADKVSKKEFTDGMERLFRAGKIHVVPYGYPSRGWTQIKRK
jgi:RecA-family ATPase